MKKPVLTLLSLATLTVLGCAKTSSDLPSATPQVACSKQFEGDLELVLKARHFVAGEAACKKFISAHGSAPSCVIFHNGVRSTAQIDRALAYCRDVEDRAERNRRIEAARTNRSEPASPAEEAAVDELKLLSEIEATQLRIRVVDAGGLRAATTVEISKLAIDGEFIAVEKLAEYLAAHPELEAEGITACSYNVDPSKVTEGLEISISTQEQSLVRDGVAGKPMLVWSASSTAGGVFTCLRLNTSKFRLKDLRQAFKGLLEIMLADS
jgi:hypothetical protein